MDDRRHHTSDPHLKLDKGPARVAVLSALSATTAAHSFNVSYRLSEVRPEPSTTTTVDCGFGPGNQPYVADPAGMPGTQVPVSARPTMGMCAVGASPAVTVTGHGTINVNPKAMVVSASISSGLDVSVRLDDQNVWESGGADYGATPNGSASGSGQPLSGFAGLTESTIGNREGAIGMLGMASPSGYLDLESQSVTGAAQDGSGTVDGVAVSYYRVAVDPSKLVDVAGNERRRDRDGQRGGRGAASGGLHRHGGAGRARRGRLHPPGHLGGQLRRRRHGHARFHLLELRLRRHGDDAG